MMVETHTTKDRLMEHKHSAQVDPKLLEILVCPLSKTTLRYDAKAQELISDKAGLAYPIRDGIPIMLADEARKLKSNEVKK
jgi:uncharacterized protein YbaR (Trm112 family)